MPTRVPYIKVFFDSNRRKRYYKNIKYPEIPHSINDLYVSTVSGDRLDLLANQFYNDVDLWWIITTANPDIIRRDSFMLEEGIELRIPSDTNQILADFKKINE